MKVGVIGDKSKKHECPIAIMLDRKFNLELTLLDAC